MPRPSRAELFMRMAHLVAERGTCARLQVGCILTDVRGEQVWMGYNGNARGLPNECDRETPGDCGCLHAEMNALIKAPGIVEKIAYVTTAPCERCAKAMVNSHVQKLWYTTSYRTEDGLSVLRRAAIRVIQFPTPYTPPPLTRAHL